jgi:hypothetical protein
MTPQSCAFSLFVVTQKTHGAPGAGSTAAMIREPKLSRVQFANAWTSGAVTVTWSRIRTPIPRDGARCGRSGYVDSSPGGATARSTSQKISCW